MSGSLLSWGWRDAEPRGPPADSGGLDHLVDPAEAFGGAGAHWGASAPGEEAAAALPSLVEASPGDARAGGAAAPSGGLRIRREAPPSSPVAVKIWNDATDTLLGVSGLKAARQAMQEMVLLPAAYPALFESPRLHPQPVLLTGPPGCGKSEMVRLLGRLADWKLEVIKMPEFVGSYVDGAARIGERFRAARGDPGALHLICFDELEVFCDVEGIAGLSIRRLLTSLLVELDSLPGNVRVVATSQRPWDLPSALRRRFSRAVMLPPPGRRARARMLRVAFSGTPHDLSEAEYDNAARRLNGGGFTGADVIGVARAAIRTAIDRYLRSAGADTLERGARSADWAAEVRVSRDDLRAAAAEARPSQRACDMLAYDSWVEESAGWALSGGGDDSDDEYEAAVPGSAAGARL